MTEIDSINIQSKEERDTLLKEAEVTRERGELEAALNMFLKIKEWDEQNDVNNPKRSAVYGHMRITYSRMALHEPELPNKKEFLSLASQCSQEGLAFMEAFPDEKGLLATMQIHAASSANELAEVVEGEERTLELNKALMRIEEAIKNLPGSEAHKAWPLRTKTEILRKLQRFPEATQCALNGIELIFKGYLDELEKDAEAAELKLLVWITGLHLELARIARDENKMLLARYFAGLVVNTTDTSGTLTERKKEAQELLDSLS